MPSVTLPSAQDKTLVRKALPSSKILTAAVARLFVASPEPNRWSYANVWGAATFCKDKSRNDSFFIRIVDLENHAGVLWEQELYDDFEYIKEKAFFHTFETDDCLAGLMFVDDGEAETFYKKLKNRDSIKLDDGKASFMKKANGRKKGIDKNQIGVPSEFRHLGHIGYTPDKGFSIENSNDPEWSGVFEQLKSLGITPEEISENQDFIHEFLQQHGGPPAKRSSANPPPPPPPPGRSARPASVKKTPPPPPPPPASRRAPPPPPPPRKSGNGRGPPPPPPSRNAAPPPPPPAAPPAAAPSPRFGPPQLPTRGSRQMPPPVPSMGRPSIPTSSVPAPPPPPPVGGAPPPPPPPPPPPAGGPPPPPAGGPPPPPPPPPPPGGPAAPPPPPPSSSGPPLPAGQDGRTNLMASIRATGGFGSLKKGGTLRNTPTESPRMGSKAAVGAGAVAGGAAAAAASSGSGGDLASSIAAVLQQRKTAMQSDDESDSDDEWE